MRRVLFAVVLMGAVLVACGGGSPSMTDAGAKRVNADVLAVRNAVGARDPDAAAAALDTLRISLDQLRRSGDVSAARAAAILVAANAVGDQLVAITTTTTTTTTTVPPSAPSNRGKGNGKEKD